MEDGTKTVRLSKVAREFNIGINTIVDFLTKKGHKIDNNPNTKLSPEAYDLLVKEYQGEKHVKEESKKIGIGLKHETITAEQMEKREDDSEKEDVRELIIKGTQTISENKVEKTGTKEKPVVKEEPIVEEVKVNDQNDEKEGDQGS
jgi:translation initiation factor IF-2